MAKKISEIKGWDARAILLYLKGALSLKVEDDYTFQKDYDNIVTLLTVLTGYNGIQYRHVFDNVVMAALQILDNRVFTEILVDSNATEGIMLKYRIGPETTLSTNKLLEILVFRMRGANVIIDKENYLIKKEIKQAEEYLAKRKGQNNEIR